MAERRMFAKTIIDSDAFVDMPATARLLYYDLSMRADDDGFVNSPKKIIRMTGASEDDLRVLIAKQFVIPFESGVVVIRHWKIHNYIQKDRYKETAYLNEKSLLSTTENKAYALKDCGEGVTEMDTESSQDGYNMDTQVRLGKDRDRIGEDKSAEDTEITDVPAVKKPQKKPKEEKVYYPLDEKLNQAMVDFVSYRKKIKSPMTEKAIELMIRKLDGMTTDHNEKIKILEQSIMNGWKGIFPLKQFEDRKGGGMTEKGFYDLAQEYAAVEGEDLF